MMSEKNTKKCPFCAEIIQADAIKCRYCGEFLEETGETHSSPESPNDANQNIATMIPCENNKNGVVDEYTFEIDSVKIVVSYQSDTLSLSINNKTEKTINERNNRYETIIKSKDNEHKLAIWYEKPTGIFPILKFWEEDGVGIEIDGIPIQGTLTDPFTTIKNGKNGLWIFFAFLVFKTVFGPFADPNTDYFTGLIGSLIVYGIPALILLYFGIRFNNRIKPAIWAALILGLLETIDFVIGTLMSMKFGVPAIVFGAIRLSALYYLFKSVSILRTVKLQ